MRLHMADERVTLWQGDCLEVLAELADASVDSVVTDPPYGLGFMGKEWDSGKSFVERKPAKRNTFDHVGGNHNPTDSADAARTRRVESAKFGAWCELWAAECLRVLKPGGHLLAFGGSRTWHRLACAVEDAGFEIRDSIAWLYGSGFPKSLDVSKAIDKANGRQFEDRFALGRHIREQREALGHTRADVNGWLGAATKAEHYESDSPGFARVPTLADWRILRERLSLSDEHLPMVERIEAERSVVGSGKSGGAQIGAIGIKGGEFDITAPATPDAEQWQGWGTALKPAFEPVVVARKPLAGTVAGNVLTHGTGALNIDACRIEGEPWKAHTATGLGRVKFFTEGDTPEIDKAPHDAGRWPANVVLDESQAAELDQQSGEFGGVAGGMRQVEGKVTFTVGEEINAKRFEGGNKDFGGASRFFYVAKADASERPRVDGIAHPTVKPLALMRWLVRLVTPPGGVVLEPFAGSGTTVEACLLERFHCIAIERETDYLPLIEARIARRRDPVRAIELAKEDAGLFALIDEEESA